MLGHQVRSDIHRPREQLSMPSMADIELDDADDDGMCALAVAMYAKLVYLVY